jgi:hypothetical protein
MPRISLLPVAILVGFLALESRAPARADLVTETVSFGPMTTDFSHALAVPTFNGNLGLLTSVAISYTDSSTMQGMVMNNASTPENYKVTENSTFTLSLGTNNLLTNTLSEMQNFTGVPANQLATFGTFTPSGSAGPLTVTSGTIFDAFLANTPDVNLNFSSLTQTSIAGGGGNADAAIYTMASATVTVTYDYEPINIITNNSAPEPSSLLMTILGGVLVSSTGLVVNGKRRRQKKAGG